MLVLFLVYNLKGVASSISNYVTKIVKFIQL